MTIMPSGFRCIKFFVSQLCRQTPVPNMSIVNCNQIRRYSDKKPKAGKTTKQVVVQGTENEQRMRVRRARPPDTPRVLRYVRDHAKLAWPGLVAPNASFHVVLGDYVARALAQGHSMVAEQQESKGSWTHIRGLALTSSVCPWDAVVLEKWAHCVPCTRSKQLMYFTAQCLRAPALHAKYRVHNVLQVILIVPLDTPRSTEIIQMLAKNTIERGRDVGFALLRFDVTNDHVARSLEGMNFKKEWETTYEIATRCKAQSGDVDDKQSKNIAEITTPEVMKQPRNFVAVYTAFTRDKVTQ